jgi:Icc-related predicted phosphoesterase
MTTVQILSDLHLEFDEDGGVGFIESLTPTADVLVLAGDICSARQIPEILSMFCSRYPDVLYVHGNHEYYGTDRETVQDMTLIAEGANKNLWWLDCDDVEINGYRFLGTPLWFRREPGAPTWAINDFSLIKRYTEWVYQQNDLALQFLHDNLKRNDIVVTHHLPTKRSIHPEFTDSPLNPFFLCDVSNFIQSRQPRLWFHGHTHHSFDYRFGHTRIVCNPRGYRDALNHRFIANLVIELE